MSGIYRPSSNVTITDQTGTPVPPDPALTHPKYLHNHHAVREDLGGETDVDVLADLIVDGSNSPIDFYYRSHPDNEILLVKIGFIATAKKINLGGGKFINKPILANGILVEMQYEDQIYNIHTIRRNEDFRTFSSDSGWDWENANEDFMHANFPATGFKLRKGSTDFMRIRIQDDLTKGVSYLRCFVKGTKVEDYAG